MQNLELDISQLSIKDIVKEAIEEALDKDISKNVGSVENHCDNTIKEYYLALANDKPDAIKEQETALMEFLNDDRF